MPDPILPRGREPVAVDQPPHGGMDYPFVNPSEDIEQLLGDLYLIYPDPGCDFTLPLKIDLMFGFGTNPVPNPSGFFSPTHDLDVVITDSQNTIVFDSSEAAIFTQDIWADRLEVVQWIAEDTVLRLTRHIAWDPNEKARDYDDFIIPLRGELDARTYRRRADRVRSIETSTVVMTDGDIVLRSGFNLNIAVEELPSVDGGRRETSLTFEAVPGSGLGTFPGCVDVEPVIRKINGVEPNKAQDFKLDAPGCYRLARPTELTIPSPRTFVFGDDTLSAAEAAAALRISNDCGPCCECIDFASVYKALTRVNDRYLDLGDRAEVTRDLHRLNIDRWNEQKACREARRGRLAALPECPCTVNLGGAFCNTLDDCLGPVELRFTLQLLRDGTTIPPEFDPKGETVCGQTFVQRPDTDEIEFGALGGEWPVFSIVYDAMSPRTAATIRFRLAVPGCEAGQSLKTTLTAHAPADADLPAVEVPPEIEALWIDAPLGPARMILEKVVPLIPANDLGECECD